MRHETQLQAKQARREHIPAMSSSRPRARSVGFFASRRSTGNTSATASMTNLAGSTQHLSAGGISARSASTSFRRATTNPKNPAESILAHIALRLSATPSAAAAASDGTDEAEAEVRSSRWSSARETEPSMEASRRRSESMAAEARASAARRLWRSESDLAASPRSSDAKCSSSCLYSLMELALDAWAETEEGFININMNVENARMTYIVKQRE
uniref:Uncharacterized protein n=1 Tax=Oryza meridionalis TaxID=40149 RepID=A0A0E0E820_9ORYZ